MEVDDHSGRFKRLLPTTISSPDRSPQARKGKKATGQKSSAKKSLSFKDVSSSVVNTDSDHNELSTLIKQRMTHLRKLANFFSHI